MTPSKTIAIHADRVRLQNQYAHLAEDGTYDAIVPGEELNERAGDNFIVAESFLPKRAKQRRYSKSDLAQVARRVHLQLWKHRRESKPNPISLLNPTTILEKMGYAVEVVESLGQYREAGETFEVAGIVDNNSSYIRISHGFAPETRLFTLAHELGHALLHSGTGLHRDRAIDGSSGRITRNQEEIEADTFAAYFLMPEKQVRIAFEHRFLAAPFELTDVTAFALASVPLHSFEVELGQKRTIARKLASAEQYNGMRFDSLAKLFNVSVEAMAIRLEEVGLIA